MKARVIKEGGVVSVLRRLKIKRSENITFRATPEAKERFDRLQKKFKFRSAGDMFDFFAEVAEILDKTQEEGTQIFLKKKDDSFSEISFVFYPQDNDTEEEVPPTTES